MPLRTAKPYFRVDKHQGKHVVTYWSSQNRQLLRRGLVQLDPQDKAGYTEELTQFVKKQLNEKDTICPRCKSIMKAR